MLEDLFLKKQGSQFSAESCFSAFIFLRKTPYSLTSLSKPSNYPVTVWHCVEQNSCLKDPAGICPHVWFALWPCPKNIRETEKGVGSEWPWTTSPAYREPQIRKICQPLPTWNLFPHFPDVFSCCPRNSISTSILEHFTLKSTISQGESLELTYPLSLSLSLQVNRAHGNWVISPAQVSPPDRHAVAVTVSYSP